MSNATPATGRPLAASAFSCVFASCRIFGADASDDSQCPEGGGEAHGRYSGDVLGKIKVPYTVANVEFGGRNRAQLFICASHTLYAIYTNVRGARRP